MSSLISTSQSTGQTALPNAGDNSHRTSIWQAARAATATPGYFQPIQIEDSLYYDGGVLVNDPTSGAWLEIQDMHRQNCTQHCTWGGDWHLHASCQAGSGGIGALVSVGTIRTGSMTGLPTHGRNSDSRFRTAMNMSRNMKSGHAELEREAKHLYVLYRRFDVGKGLKTVDLNVFAGGSG